MALKKTMLSLKIAKKRKIYRRGKVDPLIGLKENVIIGKLIPAGTGMSNYRKIDLKLDREEKVEEIDSSSVDEYNFDTVNQAISEELS